MDEFSIATSVCASVCGIVATVDNYGDGVASVAALGDVDTYYASLAMHGAGDGPVSYTEI